jgi:peptidylprolyl isomerase
MRGPTTLLLLLAVVLGTGCLSDPSTTDPDLTQVVFAPALGVDINASTRLDGGVYIRDLTVGTGTLAAVGQPVHVRYIGWLADGTKFEENPAPAPLLSFTLGANQVIRGFDAGIVGMRVGGIRQLVIPPSQGYGSAGSPPDIPGGAVIVFRVEVIGVQ